MKESSVQFFHKEVMPDKVIEALKCTSGKVFVDCTVGGAGHSVLIAKAIQPEGKLICLDVDIDAINEAKSKLKPFNNKYIVRSNFLNLPEILDNLNINCVDGGILIDLGVSYHQLTSLERGFSFRSDFKLDMRMDRNLEITAEDIINTLSVEELTDLFTRYGEEKHSKRIAQAIVKYSSKNKIDSALKLAEIVESVVPKSRDTKIHPATRVFQALRIKVNNEIEVLKE